MQFVAENEKIIKDNFSPHRTVERLKFEQFLRSNDVLLEHSLLDYIAQVSFEATPTVHTVNLDSVFKYFARVFNPRVPVAAATTATPSSNEFKLVISPDQSPLREQKQQDRAVAERFAEIKKIQS